MAWHPHEEHPRNFHWLRHVHRVCSFYGVECVERNQIRSTSYVGRRRRTTTTIDVGTGELAPIFDPNQAPYPLGSSHA